MSFDGLELEPGPGVWSGCDLATVQRYCAGSLVYLATPYTKRARHADGSYCQDRAERAAHAAAGWALQLGCLGVTAVSPIVQAQAMIRADINGELDPLDGKFWEIWCRPMLAASDAVVVPPMIGRRQSDGVRVEVEFALRCQMRVFVLGAQAGIPGVFK